MGYPFLRRRPALNTARALVTISILACASCGSEEGTLERPVLPAVPFNYTTLDLPAHFDNVQDQTPADNPVTDAGATLGRVLFYDKHLSRNDTTACATCHLQSKAFTDGRARAVGFEGGMTRRSALPLVNLRFDLPGDRRNSPGPGERSLQAGGFFWDQRAATLESLALLPIQDPIELGSDLAQVEAELRGLDYYPALFEAAFGSPQVDRGRIARALAQFLRSIVSVKSRFDVGFEQSGDAIFFDFAGFTPAENAGKRLFFTARCTFCHTPELQRSVGAFSNGLDVDPVDLGLGGVSDAIDPGTGLDAFDGLFKAPLLRNVELTAPYMHDGRFATLEEVVEHYNSGIQPHRNLARILRGSGSDPIRLNFTAEQKAELVAFLKTFTDQSLLTDPRFADPFGL